MLEAADEDRWEHIGKAEKASIERLQQAENGQTISHKEALKNWASGLRNKKD